MNTASRDAFAGFVAVIVCASAALAAPAAALPAGRYRLDVVATARASVPLVGVSKTTTVSLVDVDVTGGAVQRTCSIETRGSGYVARPDAVALAALPAQHYRFEVDGESVRADPGRLQLGNVSPLPMDVVVSGIGRFRVYVESVNHALLEGHRVDGGAAGRVVVKENHQTVKKGLPFAVEGNTVVDDAVFTLTRVKDAEACP